MKKKILLSALALGFLCGSLKMSAVAYRQEFDDKIKELFDKKELSKVDRKNIQNIMYPLIKKWEEAITVKKEEVKAAKEEVTAAKEEVREAREQQQQKQ